MNLHEYQAKLLLRKFKIPVPQGEVVDNTDNAWDAAQKVKANRWVVKAQVHAGGRGKAGGVKIVDNRDDLTAAVKNLLGKNLVTYQTDEHGQPINQILIEEPSNIDRELYLGAVIDRSSQRIVFMASTEGGVDIEQVAEKNPEKILKAIVDPLVGLQPFQCREIFFQLNLDISLLSSFTEIMLGLYQLFVHYDLNLLEINPLVLTKEGKLVCLDGKFIIDDNALFRHPELRDMRDPSQEDERETRAQKWELNYISLDGDIGCMVNGAGLAMATMDLIKLNGGRPANFLDVGGGATKERVTEAFKIILSDPKVKGILVNIFGGIVRCDLIADGIMAAVAEVKLTVPVVVRLEGNSAEIGLKKLNDSGMNIIAAHGFAEAAKRIVAEVNQKEVVNS